MQNRYVGDVGDYGKYALLRHLCASTGREPVRLGVIWCLFPDEAINNDGRHISYLSDAEYAKLDPTLHSTLRSIVVSGRRRISAISEFSCLPESTIFLDLPVSLDEMDRRGGQARVRHRETWLRACLEQTRGCELIFFDPDNGLEIASVPKQHPKAGKYIYWDELVPFWHRGHTLLIYHHLNRTTSAARQVQSLMLRFATFLEKPSIVPLVFRRGSSRVFWLVHRGDALGRELERKAGDLLQGAWSQHYRPFGWPND